jgi:hypothetical protein
VCRGARCALARKFEDRRGAGLKPRAIWNFIAGDSRYAPLGVALSLAVAYALQRSGAPPQAVEFSFVALLLATLAAAVLEPQPRG